MYFDRKDIKFYDEWFNNLLEFVHWADKERERCIPKGICGQSCYITSGMSGFMAKYPTFEVAYEQFKKNFDEMVSKNSK